MNQNKGIYFKKKSTIGLFKWAKSNDHQDVYCCCNYLAPQNSTHNRVWYDPGIMYVVKKGTVISCFYVERVT